MNKQTNLILQCLSLSAIVSLFVTLRFIDVDNIITFKNFIKNDINISHEGNNNETVFELQKWTQNSNLNVSHYIEVDPQYLILPKRKYENTEIIVLVTSPPNGFEARKIIRNTWAKSNFLRKHKTEVNFVLGLQGNMSKMINKEAERHQDILVVNVLDSYMNLTLKSVFMLKYLSDISGLYESLQTALKTDDDCFVNIPGLVHAANHNSHGKSMVGALLGHNLGHQPVLRPNTSEESAHDKWAVPYWMYPSEHFPMSISGTGYMFPVSIAECLFKSATKVPFLILEDVYITGLLTKFCDVSLKNSPQFEYMGIGDDRGSAEKLLKLVLTHRANMTEMMELYIKAWRYKGLEDLWTS